MKKLIVLCALPGSGKTTLAETLKNDRTRVVDGDALAKKASREGENPMAVLIKDVQGWGKKFDRQVLDGLFLSWQVYLAIAEAFPDWEIEYHYWTPDRPACLWNDRYRREQSAEISIRNMQAEAPDIERLKQANPNVSLVLREVKKKSEFDMFKHKYGIGDAIESDAWVLSGKSWSYNGDERTASAEEPVKDFWQLDELLEKAWPSVTVLQYNRIRRECVSESEKHDNSDYYSSYRLGVWLCDAKRLYELLSSWSQGGELWM